MFVASIVLVVLVWEGYKAVGPEKGGKIFGLRLLPKSEDSSMPHVWSMLRRYSRPEVRGSKTTIFDAVASGAWYSFRIALVGLVFGIVIGMVLAIFMARFRVAERGLLPWLIISQTVPLIALAPLVVSWGGRLKIGGFEWKKWMSAAVIGAFLAFFPIAVGALKGLTSPPTAAVELMESYAARWRDGLVKLLRKFQPV
jgi:NitT/TauT family transport system permease protein